MNKAYPTSSDADIMLLLEGTYPFVTGGVSSWVFQLIKHLPQYRFAVIFLGGQESDYTGLKYSLPDNLVHLETHYLFDFQSKYIHESIKEMKNGYDDLTCLHAKFKTKENQLLKDVHKELFSKNSISHHQFLYSKFSWEFITNNYNENCPNIIFSKYFWAVRNMHSAIWKLVDIAKHAPKTKVIHSISTGYAGLLGAFLKTEKNYPYILTEHGIYVRERRIDLLSQWCSTGNEVEQRIVITNEYQTEMWMRFFDVLAKLAYSSADPIISLFQAYHDEQVKNGASSDNAIIIPNGVPIDDSLPLRSSINQNKPIIALIGRVVPIKDIKTFIRSVMVIVKKIPYIEAWIIGPTDEDKEYYRECKGLVNVLKLNDTIKFLGQQKIADLLPKIDLIVLSSISEGLPLVLLEGFAAGIPAVTTNVGACSELIYGSTEKDKALGRSGLVVDVNNSQMLAEAIIEILQNPVQWKSAQTAGRARVSEYYSQKQFLLRYTQIYEKALHTWQG